MPTLANFLATHRSLKQRAAVPAYRAFARGNVFFPAPRVFANSFPKAGTHLLATLLQRLPRMMFSGVHRAATDYAPDGEVDRLDRTSLRSTLQSVNQGQYMTGHFPAVPGVGELLSELGYAHLLMIRDPRDIVVSTVTYVTTLRSHDLHRRFTEELTDPDDQLMAVIEGFAGDGMGRGLASLGERLAGYTAWLDDPAVLVVRFEDLIGPAGGGDQARQRETVAAVAEHVGRRLTAGQAQRMAERVWSPRSSTFRSGQSGSWQRRFSEAHREAFKRVAGAQLVRLGYETSLDW